jgi:formate hydrogenlyase transcriptional activator
MNQTPEHTRKIAREDENVPDELLRKSAAHKRVERAEVDKEVGELAKANAALGEALELSRQSERDLRNIINTIPTLAWCNLPDGSNEFLNQRWHDFTGLSKQEAQGWGWKVTIHPDDLPKLMDKWGTLLATGDPGEIEARLRRYDGEYRWFLFRVEPLHDDQGNIVRWYGTNTEIEELKRTQSLLSTEKGTLEMIAEGANLREILGNLCNGFDAQLTNFISSILLMDSNGERLWFGAGGRVPKEWAEFINPVTIGACVGSCGTAAFLKRRVIVSDIATDPLWANFRDVALRNGLRAAWSQPIISKDNEVLGTFCIYCPEPRAPNLSDIQLIEGAAHVVLVAIERDRSHAALTNALEEIRKSEAQLRQDERELRTITDAIANLVTVLATDGRILYVNKAMLDYTGLSIDEVMTSDFRARTFHPEDVERVRDERQEALSCGMPFENEQRVRRKDGEYRWFYIRYNPHRNEQGEIVRWYTTGTDIDERKRAEERVQNENLALREDIDRSSMFEEIVGSSEPLRKVLSQVAKVAPTDSTVLILGETGTGKELIARAIHKRSSRSGRAFIRVNCAAIPSSLIASELFGYEKGAFTGALQRRVGRFEAADGGTIFLDEVGDLPIEVQITLLRVLQEREFERVGSNHPISVNVRVLAATNRDLEAIVADGTFRKDLFYRLNVFPLQIPSLRERVDDIPLLVEYLIERYAKKAGKKIRSISKRTLEWFQSYDWPGNIRELQNVIERAIILCENETFSVDETWLKRSSPASSVLAVPFTGELAEREREMIETALAEARGRVGSPSGAAAKLGMPRQTLESKIKNLRINKYGFKAG